MSHDLLQTAVTAAEAGAKVLRTYFRQGNVGVESKAAHDWVSLADRESEAEIVAEIRRCHPDHHIVGEEGGVQERRQGGTSDFQWIIDPLDGTTNFLEGLPVFCISIACRKGPQTVAAVVLEPCRENLFTAVRGDGARRNGEAISVSQRPGLEDAFLATGFPFRSRPALDCYLHTFRAVFDRAGALRRCGAAALDLAYVAEGTFDGFWEFRLSPWDIAAGALLVQEAGGTVTDLDGSGGYLAGGNVVAGNPGVHRDLLQVLQQQATEVTLDHLVPWDKDSLNVVEASLGTTSSSLQRAAVEALS
ncbi:MAG: inositol monophosphatase [Deltaproteobacteria bacterium]|nr:inositol monophosphatase [Deltaproteobacteria bacterium]